MVANGNETPSPGPTLRRRPKLVLLVLTAAIAAGCGSDEQPEPADLTDTRAAVADLATNLEVAGEQVAVTERSAGCVTPDGADGETVRISGSTRPANTGVDELVRRARAAVNGTDAVDLDAYSPVNAVYSTIAATGRQLTITTHTLPDGNAQLRFTTASACTETA